MTLAIVATRAGVEEQLEGSGLWQHLPSIQNGNLLRLPPVWSFGALPSAQRFARELTTALNAHFAG